jgi:hypothetical protein
VNKLEAVIDIHVLEGVVRKSGGVARSHVQFCIRHFIDTKILGNCTLNHDSELGEKILHNDSGIAALKDFHHDFGI